MWVHRVFLVVAFLVLALQCNATPANVSLPSTAMSLTMAGPGILRLALLTGPHPELNDDAQSEVSKLVPGHFNMSVVGKSGQAAWVGSPSAVWRHSLPYDQNAAKQVWVRQDVFLDYSSIGGAGLDVLADQTVAVHTLWGLVVNVTMNARTMVCDAIKVNQVGYSGRSSRRFAAFGVYLGNGGSRELSELPVFDVVHESSAAVVVANTTGELVAREDFDVETSSQLGSGEIVYWLWLDSVPDGGRYFVSVRNCGRSPSFGVGSEYTKEVSYVSVRGLYHQRCGMALHRNFTRWTRETCHESVADTGDKWSASHWIHVPETGVEWLNVTGGYHDAADFDRRPMHFSISTLMLSYFEGFPSHFADGQYDLPESGNGLPDFLDEILWGVRLWEGLQVVDGGVNHGCVRQGTEASAHPGYGAASAASDDLVYGTFECGVETTAWVAGIFAHTARVLRPYDCKHADDLSRRAVAAYCWVEAQDDVRRKYASRMYMNLQLYLDTKSDVYHVNFEEVGYWLLVKGVNWPHQYLAQNSASTVQSYCFVSYLLAEDRGSHSVNATIAGKARTRMLDYADRGGYMSKMPESQGYGYPQGVSKFMGWGAGTAQGRYADLWVWASLFTSDAVKRQKYIDAVSQLHDYSLGLNPLGTSYYTGLGSEQPHSVAHLDSYYTKYGESDGVSSEHEGSPIGQVPGILVYGPSSGRSGASYQKAITDKMYPVYEEAPQLRRWAHGWSLIAGNEFTTWETIVWNACMNSFLYSANGVVKYPEAVDSRCKNNFVPESGLAAGWCLAPNGARTDGSSPLSSSSSIESSSSSIETKSTSNNVVKTSPVIVGFVRKHVVKTELSAAMTLALPVFGEQEQQLFIDGVASSLNVSRSSVSLTNVTKVSRRRLFVDVESEEEEQKRGHSNDKSDFSVRLPAASVQRFERVFKIDELSRRSLSVPSWNIEFKVTIEIEVIVSSSRSNTNTTLGTSDSSSTNSSGLADNSTDTATPVATVDLVELARVSVHAEMKIVADKLQNTSNFAVTMSKAISEANTSSTLASAIVDVDVGLKIVSVKEPVVTIIEIPVYASTDDAEQGSIDDAEQGSISGSGSTTLSSSISDGGAAGSENMRGYVSLINLTFTGQFGGVSDSQYGALLESVASAVGIKAGAVKVLGLTKVGRRLTSKLRIQSRRTAENSLWELALQLRLSRPTASATQSEVTRVTSQLVNKSAFIGIVSSALESIGEQSLASGISDATLRVWPATAVVAVEAWTDGSDTWPFSSISGDDEFPEQPPNSSDQPKTERGNRTTMLIVGFGGGAAFILFILYWKKKQRGNNQIEDFDDVSER